MKLPADAIIAREKMTRYLLRRQQRGDKSAFLARAGYTSRLPINCFKICARNYCRSTRRSFIQPRLATSMKSAACSPARTESRCVSAPFGHLSGVTKFITLIPER